MDTDIEPIFVDRRTGKRMLGNIGDTMFYQLVNEGEIERRYIGNKAVFGVASIKSLAARLSDKAPAQLAKRNGNLKFVEA